MGQVNVDKLIRDFYDTVLPLFVSTSITRFEQMRPGDIDRKALACIFVDDRQALQLLSVGAGVEHKAIGSDSIGTGGRQWPRPTVCNTPPRSLVGHREASVPSNQVSCELVHRLNHRCILEGCRFSTL